MKQLIYTVVLLIHFIQWEIPYGSKDEFGYQTNNEIKNRYIFEFTVLSVYKNDELKKDNLSNENTLVSDIYKTLILKKFKIDLFDSEPILFDDWKEEDLYRTIIFFEYSKELDDICKKIDSEVFDYFSIL